jgi:hypothetical protein
MKEDRIPKNIYALKPKGKRHVKGHMTHTASENRDAKQRHEQC